LGQYELAAQAYKRATELDLTVAIYFAEYGTALNRLQRWDDALPYFRKALALDNGSNAASSGWYHCDYGLSLANHGDLPEAESQSQIGLALLPTYTEYRNQLAMIRKQIKASQ
jgi:tetratricopeptide (TPR) repeat protein